MPIGYTIVLLSVSLVTFFLYALDKRRAKRGGGRIPELCLLTLAALGGGAGAFIGMQLLRHKTNIKRKAHFVIGVPICMLSQLFLLAWLWL